MAKDLLFIAKVNLERETEKGEVLLDSLIPENSEKKTANKGKTKI